MAVNADFNKLKELIIELVSNHPNGHMDELLSVWLKDNKGEPLYTQYRVSYEHINYLKQQVYLIQYNYILIV